SLTKHPFSRSYGVILPSSLTRVVPLTFEYSSCLPVSVSGTRTHHLTRGFSRQCGIRNFGTHFPSPSQLGSRWTDLPIQLPHCLGAHIHRCAFHILLRHPIVQTVIRRSEERRVGKDCRQTCSGAREKSGTPRGP